MENDICTIWYNPACSNCRGTKKILEEQGVPLRFRHYLEDPPNAEELSNALQHISPLELVRQKENEFDEWRDRANQLTTSEILDILITHPKLIQRPVIFWKGKVVISRPPERALELFNNE